MAFGRPPFGRSGDDPGLPRVGLGLARLALLWEALWPALWPALGVALGFVAVSLMDLWRLVPGWLHLALLIATAGAFGFALWRGLSGLRPPDWAAAERRLERDNGLEHRPITAIEDDLASDPRDPAQVALWRRHQRRMRDRLSGLKVRWPRAGLARRDPWGIRAVVGLMLTIGLFAAGSDAGDRLAYAFRPDLSGAGPGPAVYEAWINPPDYTATAPILLRPGAAGAPAAALVVPTGSKLLAKLHGGRGLPRVLIGGTAHDFEAIDADDFQIEVEITGGDRLAFRQGETVLAEWPLVVLPDAPPTIEFAEAPQASARKALKLAAAVSDDYGVARARAEIRRDGDDDVIELDLALPRQRPRDAVSVSFHDLTPHPWAGLEVRLQLVAEDDAGQTGRTAEISIQLPEREFRHPVAKALIEQRKLLTTEPERRALVARVLGAITRQPENYYDDTVAHLAMRVARARLLRDKTGEQIASVQDLLWETALRIEDGALSVAERDLRRLQRELMDALARGAPDAEIERLMAELRTALDRFLAALAEQALRRAAEQGEIEELDDQSQLLSSETLRRMLDRAQELSRSGAREAARELLAQMQELLENLRAGKLARTSPEQQAGEQMLDRLGRLMDNQQKLLDRTFRRSRRSGRPSPGSEQPGSQGPPRFGQRPSGDGFDPESFALGAEQEAIRRQLGELMRQLSEQMGDIPGGLGRAERSMLESRRNLEEGQPGNAVGPQTRALDQLRQGAESILREMMERFGDQLQNGQGTAQSGNGDRDPLGRPLGGQWDYGDSVKVPDQGDLQRAKEILEELYRRAGERGRSRQELDYIDRLLRRF